MNKGLKAKILAKTMEHEIRILKYLDRMFGASARAKNPEAMSFLKGLRHNLPTPEETETRSLECMVEVLNLSPVLPIETVRTKLKELAKRIYDVDFEQTITGANSPETYAADITVAGGDLLKRLDSVFGRIEVRDGKYHLQ